MPSTLASTTRIETHQLISELKIIFKSSLWRVINGTAICSTNNPTIDAKIEVNFECACSTRVLYLSTVRQFSAFARFDLKMLKFEEEVKEKRTFGKFKQFLATICLGPITMGCFLNWTSPVLPQFEDRNSTTPFHLTTNEGSWVGAMLAIGALTAAIPAGYLADLVGSKKCILALTIPSIVFTLLVVFSTNLYMLCVARIFSGFAIGGISAVGPMYISEISDVSLRGTLSSFFELLIYAGITFTAVVGAYMDYVVLTNIIGSLTVILGFVFVFLPESPTYLMKMRKRDEAERALRFYRSKNYNVGEVLDQIHESIEKRSRQKLNILRTLNSKATVRGFVACVGLTSFQQLSAIDGITFYTVQIFQAAGAGQNPYTSAIIMSSVELVSAVLVMLIVEKVDRKVLLYFSTAGTCVCLAAFGLYFNLKEQNVYFYGIAVLPLVSMFAYNVAFAAGLGPIPWMINGELFVPEIKGLAGGITIATNWILLFIITKNLPVAMESWGPHYTFYMFSTFMAICIVFVKFCVPETRGKTLEQIQIDLSS